MAIPIPIHLTAGGAQPATPEALRQQLLDIALVLAPGLTADLPGTLIDDIASTDVGALAVTDSLYVDLINSISPFAANEGLLLELGAVYGVPRGIGSNGSVNVVFSGPAGFVINRGFQVTDGTYQYTVQDGGIIPTGGVSVPIFCVAVQSGIFPIPVNTVNALATSVPTTVPPVTCNNPVAGIPAAAEQTVAQYRLQVLQAGLASAQGMPTFLRTLLEAVPGVQARLVSIQQDGGEWIVICGGGDPYEVGYAIFKGVPDIANLRGGTLNVTAISNTNPGVVTTDIAHGYTTSDIVTIEGAMGITGINGVPLTITVLTPYTFSIGIDTTASGAYAGGGVLTPNLRNQVVSIDDTPDTYDIPFVVPLQQLVTINLTWNTNSPNFVNPAAIAALAQQPLVDYVNSVTTGQPLNIFQMESIFKASVATILAPELITRMVFGVTINGVNVSPNPGTGIIPGDAQSYFETFLADVTIVQG
jgi:hypothetical protein